MSEYPGPGLAQLSPIASGVAFLSAYGWWVVGAVLGALWLASALRPRLERWRQAREDADYHKDPDKVLQRMEQIQRARERQQQQLEAESALARQRQLEREERKRQEVAALLAAAGSSGAGGSRLGSGAEYLPLSGSGAGSSYRPPKKSKCGGGGCGR